VRRQRANQLDAVGRHHPAGEADPAGVGGGGELGVLGGRQPAQPQRAFLARAERGAVLAVGDALREQLAHLLGERVEAIRLHQSGLVADRERALVEIGLDRDHPRALAQPVGEDLEAALPVVHPRQVSRGPARAGRGGLGVLMEV
jgi:hypothetical protein